ncbi:MAG TPA: LysM peptidoglycan-binding domain-containing protein, partial [Candidatus Melainabacteria bacterium]|nr:LysM peptidoglycan-binding domain-containing protein [Candidatus Melainabacteria bacterium]
ENQRNNATLNTARDAFHMMQQEGRNTYARTDLQRTDNLTPAARSHAQAMENFISLRERMRAIDPASIHEGQISVSGLKTALQRSPGYFLPNEREAANNLLANRDTLAQSTGFFNRLYNMGNTDGMYFSQETLANRARELGVTGLNGYGPQLPGAIAFQQPGQPYINRTEATFANFDQLQPTSDLRMDLPQFQTQIQPQDNALALQPASDASPRGFMPSGDARFTLYSVRKNDTLSAISRDFLTRSSGSTPSETQVYNFVNAIARESGIANPNLIHPNQTLRIPANWQLAVQPGYSNQR